MMNKPTFVCVPGAWHGPSCYDSLKSILEGEGYDCVTITLPSVGCKPVTFDFTEDVDAVRLAIQRLADDGKDIIPVMHSYGGMCGSQALEGFAKKERESQGLQGGVVRIVYIMAMMLPEGTQPAPRGTTENMTSFMKADLEAGIVTVSSTDAISVFYNDFPPAEAEKLASQLKPQSIGVFYSTITYAPWRVIPTTYVLCEQDQSFTMPYAEYLLSVAKSTDDHKIDTLEKCDAGHFVMGSNPQWVADVLKRAASSTA